MLVLQIPSKELHKIVKKKIVLDHFERNKILTFLLMIHKFLLNSSRYAVKIFQILTVLNCIHIRD